MQMELLPEFYLYSSVGLSRRLLRIYQKFMWTTISKSEGTILSFGHHCLAIFQHNAIYKVTNQIFVKSIGDNRIQNHNLAVFNTEHMLNSYFMNCLDYNAQKENHTMDSKTKQALYLNYQLFWIIYGTPLHCQGGKLRSYCIS